MRTEEHGRALKPDDERDAASGKPLYSVLSLPAHNAFPAGRRAETADRVAALTPVRAPRHLNCCFRVNCWAAAPTPIARETALPYRSF